MHPIERLRYVARASGAPQAVLVRETAAALGSLAFDPAGLVTACRRVLDGHPACGSLWWLAAHVLTTVGDPDEEGWRCAEELEDDPTAYGGRYYHYYSEQGAYSTRPPESGIA